MAAPTFTTRLEAVNAILRAVARAPVTAIAPTNPQDALTADAILEETNREVQSRGWHFNTERKVTLTPVASEITLGADVARIDIPRGYSNGDDYVRRGTRLFNITDQTYTIESEVKADIVRFLDFEDLPESARYYIMIRSARRMQDQFLTDTRRARYSREDEFQAHLSLVNDELNLAENNFFHNPDSVEIAYRRESRIRGPWIGW